MEDLKPKPYVTERTKMWRSRDIKADFIRAIDIIEEFGCQVMSVGAGEVSPTFSYTAGVTDTLGHPELITVGLPISVAHSALNEAVRRMTAGLGLTKGKHANSIGDVDVEFRPISPIWLHHTMLRTNWYYEGADVPVLQLIYPDLENKFADEEGFNNYFAQPDLSLDRAKPGSLEYDLWRATIPSGHVM